MTPVPPGDQTGIYYIIVAGLPWQCSWQKLKDFARNQQPDGSWIEVDHAMVYPDTTNGWVRVKGKSDFLKVLAHLNGGVLENRSLIADGRNETEVAYLCDLGTTRRGSEDSMTADHSASSGYQQYAGQGRQTYQTPENCSEWNSQTHGNYNPVSRTFPPGTWLTPSFPIYEAAPNAFAVTQQVDYFAPPAQSTIVYAGSMAPATPVYIPQRQPVYAWFNTGLVSPPSTIPNLQEIATNNTVTGPVVQTEARKVIIKGLSRDTSQSALVRLIDELYARSCSRSSRHNNAAIQYLELARHPDGKLKGHAFVVFESHKVAKRVVATIDGHKFQGRELRATLAKEGVEPTETFHQQGYLSPDSPVQNSERSSMIHSNSDIKQFSSQQPAMWATAEGSMKEYEAAQWTGEGSSKTLVRGKEQVRESNTEDRGRKARPKSREPRGPPVVDGTGRRRH